MKWCVTTDCCKILNYHKGDVGCYSIGENALRIFMVYDCLFSVK